MLSVYVAGPFFNKTQYSFYEGVVRTIESVPCKVYSVVRDGIICKPDDSPDVRERVFALNAEKIEECDLMVCILDYMGEELISSRSNLPISIPDTGTIWEAGAAWMSHKPVLGIRTARGPINLMISQSMVYIATGDRISLPDSLQMTLALSDIKNVVSRLSDAATDMEEYTKVIADLRSRSWTDHNII